MWININGEQYVRFADVMEAVKGALDALSPQQKNKPVKEVKQVEGQIPLFSAPLNFSMEASETHWEPRNGKKLPRDKYMAERERVYEAIVSRVGIGVKLSRKEIADIAGVSYDVARVHIRSLIVARAINKDDIIAIARPKK
jgi:DNA-binding CsgD family transcriptional regulator